MSIYETVLRYEGPSRTDHSNFLAHEKRIEVKEVLYEFSVRHKPLNVILGCCAFFCLILFK